MAAALGAPPGLSAPSPSSPTSNSNSPSRQAHGLPPKPETSTPPISSSLLASTSTSNSPIMSSDPSTSSSTSQPAIPFSRTILDPNRKHLVYSRKGLLHLSKSGMVNVPVGMPTLKSWYGEWVEPSHQNTRGHNHPQSSEGGRTNSSNTNSYSNSHRDEAPHRSRRQNDRSEELEPSNLYGGSSYGRERRGGGERDDTERERGYLPNTQTSRRGNNDGTSGLRKDNLGGERNARRYEDRDGGSLGSNHRERNDRSNNGVERERNDRYNKDKDGGIGLNSSGGKNPFGQISASGTFKPAGTPKSGSSNDRNNNSRTPNKDFSVLREKKRNTKDIDEDEENQDSRDGEEEDGWESVPRSPETERRLARAAADSASDWRRGNSSLASGLGARIASNSGTSGNRGVGGTRMGGIGDRSGNSREMNIEERRRTGGIGPGGALGNGGGASSYSSTGGNAFPSWMNDSDETPAWMNDDGIDDTSSSNRRAGEDESTSSPRSDRFPTRNGSANTPTKGRFSFGRKAEEDDIIDDDDTFASPSTQSKGGAAGGMDSIQAFKAQMKEKERREKERIRRELEVEEERKRERDRRNGIVRKGENSNEVEKKSESAPIGPPPGLDVKPSNDNNVLSSIPPAQTSNSDAPNSQSGSIFDTFSNSHKTNISSATKPSAINTSTSKSVSLEAQPTSAPGTGRSRFASRFGNVDGKPRDPQAAALAAQQKLLGARSPSLNENGPGPASDSPVEASGNGASGGALAELFANASIGKKEPPSSAPQDSEARSAYPAVNLGSKQNSNPPQSDAANMQRIMALLQGGGVGGAGGSGPVGASALAAALEGRSTPPQIQPPAQNQSAASPKFTLPPGQPGSGPGPAEAQFRNEQQLHLLEHARQVQQQQLREMHQHQQQQQNGRERPSSRGPAPSGVNVGPSPHYLALQQQQQQQQQQSSQSLHAQHQHQHAQQQAQLHLMRQQALEAQARATALRGGMTSTPPPGWGNAGSGNRPSPSLSPGPNGNGFGRSGNAGSIGRSGGPPGIVSPVVGQGNSGVGQGNGQNMFGLGLSASSNRGSAMNSPINEGGPQAPGPPPIPPQSLRQQQQQQPGGGSGNGPNLSGLPLHVQQQLMNMPPHIQMQFLQRNFPPPPGQGHGQPGPPGPPPLPPHLLMQQQQHQQQQLQHQQQHYNGIPPPHHQMNPYGGMQPPLPPPHLQGQGQGQAGYGGRPPPPGMHLNAPQQGMNLMALLSGNHQNQHGGQ